MCFSTDIGFQIDLGDILASIFRALGCFGAVLGDFFAPRSPPSLPRGALGRPRALQEEPRDPQRATQGAKIEAEAIQVDPT